MYNGRKAIITTFKLHLLGKLYQGSKNSHQAVDSVEERHRHRYEINTEYVDKLEEAGMKFVGHSVDNTRMEILELSGMLIFS